MKITHIEDKLIEMGIYPLLSTLLISIRDNKNFNEWLSSIPDETLENFKEFKFLEEGNNDDPILENMQGDLLLTVVHLYRIVNPQKKGVTESEILNLGNTINLLMASEFLRRLEAIILINKDNKNEWPSKYSFKPRVKIMANPNARIEFKTI